jgi:hypothetical protein
MFRAKFSSVSVSMYHAVLNGTASPTLGAISSISYSGLVYEAESEIIHFAPNSLGVNYYLNDFASDHNSLIAINYETGYLTAVNAGSTDALDAVSVLRNPADSTLNVYYRLSGGTVKKYYWNTDRGSADSAIWTEIYAIPCYSMDAA